MALRVVGPEAVESDETVPLAVLPVHTWERLTPSLARAGSMRGNELARAHAALARRIAGGQDTHCVRAAAMSVESVMRFCVARGTSLVWS